MGSDCFPFLFKIDSLAGSGQVLNVHMQSIYLSAFFACFFEEKCKQKMPVRRDGKDYILVISLPVL